MDSLTVISVQSLELTASLKKVREWNNLSAMILVRVRTSRRVN
jgi:hypothetical protein